MILLMFKSVTLLIILLPYFVTSSSLNALQYNIISNDLENYVTGSTKDLPPDLSTPELIKRRGYPLETHEILTGDGYILVAHRIPYGKRSPKGYDHKFPVFVFHGTGQSSADWVLNFEEDNCLPFLLANKGYDVWLGNVRGNMYSNRHLNLSHEQTKFWDFSNDEVANFDIPDTMDYILSKTNRLQLHYIGFSMGTRVIFMALSNKPQYNQKIRINIAYAPSIFSPKESNSLNLVAVYLERALKLLQKSIGGFPAPPQGISFLISQLLPKICNPKVDRLGVCRQIMFLILGFGPDQISREQTPSILGHLSTPTSLKTFIHVLQMRNADRFSRYDHGPSRNRQIYGQTVSPDYDLSLVTSPTALFLGRNDRIANKKSVDKLARALPNVVEYYTVPFANFTHLDFTYGSGANHLVYAHTIDILNNFTYY